MRHSRQSHVQDSLTQRLSRQGEGHQDCVEIEVVPAALLCLTLPTFSRLQVARTMAPSVIYIDEVEKVFVSDKKKAREFGGQVRDRPGRCWSDRL